MTEPNSEICQICQQPKNAGGSGSLTQWINCCQCNLSAAPESELITVCRACGKRIKEGRSGSVTQWIFADHICKCQNPQPAKMKTTGTTFKSKAFENHDNDPDEDGLNIDESLFPTDRYKPLRLLGHGALGQVYLCRDNHLRKRVALKSLFALTDERVVSFQQEAKTASKLNHEKVIKVFDFGTSASGRPYMVMEYFPGRSLEEVISANGFLEQDDCCLIFQSICEALSHLHEHGIFHRDLKPSNILILETETGEIDLRLIDFGLSKTTQDVQEKTNVQGRTVVGTPGYMSPDQASGREYDARSEIYSLGCIMYEALAGQPPFSGESSLEILSKHINSKVIPLQDLAPDVSAELCAIIEKCLSKNPVERYQSAAEISDALEGLRRVSPPVSSRTASSEYRIEIPSQRYRIDLLTETKAHNAAGGKILLLICLVVVLGATAIFYSVLFDTAQVKPSTNRLQRESDRLLLPSTDTTNPDEQQRARLIQRMKKSNVSKMDLRLACVDDDLLVLSGKKRLINIDLSNNPISDRGIENLQNVPNLEILLLKNTKVKTLKDISKLKKLKTLKLDQTEINDDSLKRLKGMQIKDLSIVETRITDKGLDALVAVPSLERLNLSRNEIGPAALRLANKLPNLRYIDVRDTFCLAKDAEKIAKSNLNIQTILVSDSQNQISKLREQFPTMTFRAVGTSLIEEWSANAEKEFIEGRYENALKIYEKAYAACRARPSDRQNVQAVETGMSYCLLNLNQFKRAAELQRKLIADYRTSKDKNSELNTLKMYTQTLLQLKEFDEADKQQERLVKLSEQLKGIRSREHCENEYSWVLACFNVGRFDKSIGLARDLRARSLRELGSDDPLIGALKIVEASALQVTNKSGYFPLYKDGLAILDSVSETELSPNERLPRQTAQLRLLVLQFEAGNFKEVESLSRAFLQSQDLLAADLGNRINAYELRCQALEKLGRIADAKSARIILEKLRAKKKQQT